MAAAAYTSCSKIYNDYDGLTHDYSRKGGLKYSRVFLPTHAPPEWTDRAVLWNAVETAEKTKNSRLAREIIVALPVELTLEQNIRLIEEYVKTQFVDDGMCADVSIHDTDGHNPHAHILLTVRPLKENGGWQSKTEKEYLFIRDGVEQGFTASEFLSAQKDGWEKQYLYLADGIKKYLPPSQAKGCERISKYPKSSKLGRQNQISQKWNSKEQLFAWRRAWAEEMNRHLELAGHSIRVDHRSFKAQGIDRQPTIHEGVFAARCERRGRKSDRREINRSIFRDNIALAYWAEAVIDLTKALVMLIPVIANLLEAIRTQLIILIYDWKYNHGKMSEKRDDIARMKRAVPYIRANSTVLEQKRTEKAELEAELQHIPKIRKKKRKEIEAKIYGINEEISELEAEQNRLSQIAGSTVEDAERRIRATEGQLGRLEKWDESLDEAIEEAIEQFRAKKAEAADCNQTELNDERIKLRPQKYGEAYDTIEEQYGICDMSRLLASQKNAAKLLGEEPDDKIVFPKPEIKKPAVKKHRDDIEI